MLYCQIWYLQKHRLVNNDISREVGSGYGPRDLVFKTLVNMCIFLETAQKVTLLFRKISFITVMKTIFRRTAKTGDNSILLNEELDTKIKKTKL